MKKVFLYLIPPFAAAAFLLYTLTSVPSSGTFKLEGAKEEKENTGKFSKAFLAKEAAERRARQLADENGEFHLRYYTEAVNKAKQLQQEGNRSGLNLQWEELGPDNIGGRTRAILVDKRDPSGNTLYAGGVSGGMWKSVNAGNSWSRLNWNEWMSISCITQDANGKIYIGTGEDLAQITGSSLSSGQIGNGIYTLDGNDNPVHLPSTAAHVNGNLVTNSPWGGVNRIAVYPPDPNIIFAATQRGLWKSTDAGNNWVEMTLTGVIPAGTRFADVQVSHGGLYIYAATTNGKIVRSRNAGSSIENIGAAANGWPTGIGRVEIAVSKQSEALIWVHAAGVGGQTKNALKSSNGGDNWQIMGVVGPAFDPCGDNNQCWYDNVIAINPADSNKVYVGGILTYTYSPNTGWKLAELYFAGSANPNWTHPDKHAYVFDNNNPEILYVGTDGGIFKSTNALSGFPYPTYQAKNRGFNVTQMYSVAAAATGEVLGGAQDNGTIYIDYKGNTPRYGEDVRGGDGIYTDFSVIDPRISFAGVYFGALTRSANFTASYSGIFDLKIDPQGELEPTQCGNPGSTAPFITPFLLAETKTATNSVDEYIDNGVLQTRRATFTADRNYSAGETVNIKTRISNYFFPYTLTADLAQGQTISVPDQVKSRMFLSSSCGVWMTPDALELSSIPRWYKLNVNSNGGNVSMGTPNSFATTKDGNTVFVGTTGGRVYKFSGLNTSTYIYPAGDFTPAGGGGPSYLDGLSITSVAIPGVNPRSIEGIYVDPNNDDHVLCVVSGFTTAASASNVFRSLDGGATFTNISNNLPKMPAYDCIIDASNPDNYIIGTELGIWTSSDAGQTWAQDNNEMGVVPVFRLRQQYLREEECHVIYAGTHGRGMWRTTTLTNAACNTNNTKEVTNTVLGMNFYPNPVTSSATIDFEFEQATSARLMIMELTGRVVMSKDLGRLPQGSSRIPLSLEGLAAGSYIATIAYGNKQTASKVFQKK